MLKTALRERIEKPSGLLIEVASHGLVGAFQTGGPVSTVTEKTLASMKIELPTDAEDAVLPTDAEDAILPTDVGGLGRSSLLHRLVAQHCAVQLCITSPPVVMELFLSLHKLLTSGSQNKARPHSFSRYVTCCPLLFVV